MSDTIAHRGRNSFELYRAGNSNLEIRLTVALVLAGRRWRSALDEALRPLNQSAARMEALAAIINSPPMSAQVDIAKRLRIEGPTLTRMLDALEADGLVQRLPDPADRRTKQLKVTAKGEDALKEMFDIADEMRIKLFEGYTDEQLAMLNELSWGIVNKLDEGLVPCL
ncbi:MAG: MarR family transcriptional regulator [Novosphingobium sp.]|nr:MarR family transcriptional regulator [Novosphingobium sp.]